MGLWFSIIESQTETGTPYMLYKDACNRKSNQQNLGTIRCSNLCTEIFEYTSPGEVAVCNLASIALNMFVTPDCDEHELRNIHDPNEHAKRYDFEQLKKITKVVTKNLNKVI